MELYCTVIVAVAKGLLELLPHVCQCFMEVTTSQLRNMVEEITFVPKELKIKHLNLIPEHNIINMSA
jgi:hypothetical protein